MNWVRSKPPEQVRASALAMITAKTRHGCGFYVDAYVDLARRFGATDAEIATARTARPPEPDQGIRETSRYADRQQSSTPSDTTRNTMSEQPATRPRVLSGITATGKLHIGNYIGALNAWAQQQDRFENYFFIADLHALTIPEAIQADALRERIKEIVALYLACGLDTAKSVLFLQSRVPAHASLGWILDCMTPVGWLERMTQYKAKSERANPSAGLFTYPCLMAADILLYQADYVPVGDDQRQHIEITRDIAQRFNTLFGEAFTIPAPMIPTTGARIMGLDDPTIKMSKSLAEVRDGHAIGLLDPPNKIRKSIMRAVTDSGTEVRRDHLSPGVENLLVLFEVLANTSRADALAQFEGKGYGVLKKAVAEAAIERVTGIQQRYHDIRADEANLDKILATGAEKAAAVADETLHKAMRLTGLL